MRKGFAHCSMLWLRARLQGAWLGVTEREDTWGRSSKEMGFGAPGRGWSKSGRSMRKWEGDENKSWELHRLGAGDHGRFVLERGCGAQPSPELLAGNTAGRVSQHGEERDNPEPRKNGGQGCDVQHSPACPWLVAVLHSEEHAPSRFRRLLSRAEPAGRTDHPQISARCFTFGPY